MIYLYVILFAVWLAGVGSYIALSLMAVPDFVPSRLIKVNWLKAAVWPLALVWLVLTALWFLVTTRFGNQKTKQETHEQEALEIHEVEH